MKRYTLKLYSQNKNTWHNVSIPRGRVVRISYGPMINFYGAGQVTVYYSFRQALDEGSYISILDTGLRHGPKDVDEETKGNFYFRIAAEAKLTPVMTFWYEDEVSPKFQSMV